MHNQIEITAVLVLAGLTSPFRTRESCRIMLTNGYLRTRSRPHSSTDSTMTLLLQWLMTLQHAALHRGRIEHYKMSVAQFTEAAETGIFGLWRIEQANIHRYRFDPSKGSKFTKVAFCSKGHLMPLVTLQQHFVVMDHAQGTWVKLGTTQPLKSTEGYKAGYRWCMRIAIWSFLTAFGRNEDGQNGYANSIDVFGTVLISPVKHVTLMKHVVDCRLLDFTRHLNIKHRTSFE